MAKNKRPREVEETSRTPDTDVSTPEKETVEVEFEIFEPNERFTKGVRLQIQPFCQQTGLEVFDVADCIIEQVNIGSIICVPDEEVSSTVLGVVSLLNLEQHRTQLKPLIKYLNRKLDKHQDQAASKAMKKALKDASKVGIVIAGRIPNVPDTVMASAYEGIATDVEWSLQAEDCPADEREYYKFSQVIGFGIVYKEVGAAKKRNAESLEYLHPESAHLRKLAEAVVDIPTGKSVSSDDGKAKFEEFLMVYQMSYPMFAQVGSALQEASCD